MDTGPRPRAGASAVETMVGLLLGALLLQLGWALLSTQRRAVGELIRGAEASGAARTVRGVLLAAVRAGRTGADWWAFRDSVSLRRFRGTGLACGPPEEGRVLVAFRGPLRPRPGVDSVLHMDGDGVWRGALLVDAAPAEGACPPGRGGTDERWTLEPAPRGRPGVLRLFRRGSYHLADGALRYRRGAGGRQPLTPPVLDVDGSVLEPGPAGTVRLRLRFRSLPDAPGLNPRDAVLRGAGG